MRTSARPVQCTHAAGNFQDAHTAESVDGAYQFAIMVFAVAAVLHIVRIRTLLLAQEPGELGAVINMEENGQISVGSHAAENQSFQVFFL